MVKGSAEDPDKEAVPCRSWSINATQTVTFQSDKLQSACVGGLLTAEVWVVCGSHYRLPCKILCNCKLALDVHNMVRVCVCVLVW